MLNKTDEKVFNATIQNIQNNAEIKELLQSPAFIEFLSLQSVFYEKYMNVAQDETVSDEKRLRALELVKLIQSTFNFFENYKFEE